MVFTKSVPATAASWRESSASHSLRHGSRVLYDTTPPLSRVLSDTSPPVSRVLYDTAPPIFRNTATNLRIRRLNRNGVNAIRQPTRSLPNTSKRAHTVGRRTFTDKYRDRIGQDPSSPTEQVTTQLY